MISLAVETENFRQAFLKFQTTSKKSIAENLKKQGKLLVQEIAARTPPNDIKGGKGGKQVGENAIKGDQFGGRDVNVGGFRTKTRGFFIVSDGKIVQRDEIVSLFTNKHGKQYGVEKKLYRPNASVGDMIAHRDKYRSKTTGRMSRAGLRTRNVGRHVFIDRMVVSKAAANRFLKELYRRVGYMAAGWANAARSLGGSLPGWMTRHQARGSGRVEVRGDDFELVLSNNNVYPELKRITETRAAAALRQRFWQLKKQTDNYMKRAAKDAGFTVGGS